MIAEMGKSIFWPSGAVLVVLFIFFYAVYRWRERDERHKAAVRENVDLRNELVELVMKNVELQTQLSMANATTASINSQLKTLMNAAVVLAGNRRIRRQDYLNADDYARKFEAVQRRRHHLSVTLETQLAELLGTRHPRGIEGINVALTSMVRQAILMSKEDPDFNHQGNDDELLRHQHTGVHDTAGDGDLCSDTGPDPEPQGPQSPTPGG